MDDKKEENILPIEQQTDPDRKIIKLEEEIEDLKEKRTYQGDIIPGAIKPGHLVAGTQEA